MFSVKPWVLLFLWSFFDPQNPLKCVSDKCWSGAFLGPMDIFSSLSYSSVCSRGVSWCGSTYCLGDRCHWWVLVPLGVCLMCMSVLAVGLCQLGSTWMPGSRVAQVILLSLISVRHCRNLKPSSRDGGCFCLQETNCVHYLNRKCVKLPSDMKLA